MSPKFAKRFAEKLPPSNTQHRPGHAQQPAHNILQQTMPPKYPYRTRKFPRSSGTSTDCNDPLHPNYRVETTDINGGNSTVSPDRFIASGKQESLTSKESKCVQTDDAINMLFGRQGLRIAVAHYPSEQHATNPE